MQDPDDRWYIDMPWNGNSGNLEMVCVADDLLSFLDTEKKHRVEIEVVPSDTYKEMPGYFYCDKISKSMIGGSFYYVKDLVEKYVYVRLHCALLANIHDIFTSRKSNMYTLYI